MCAKSFLSDMNKIEISFLDLTLVLELFSSRSEFSGDSLCIVQHHQLLN